MVSRWTASSALAALFLAMAAPASMSMAQADTVPSLTADADGAVQVTPDLVVVSLGVVSQATTASAALGSNNADMTKVMAAIKAAGVADADVATTDFAIRPLYATDRSPPTKIDAYEVSNSVTVKIHDVEHSGATLDKILSAGANNVGGIAFTLADPSPADDQALAAAISEARRKGQLMAAAAGVKLGRILSVTSSSQNFSPRLMARSLAAPAAVPLAAGEQSVTAHATIVWEITPQ